MYKSGYSADYTHIAPHKLVDDTNKGGRSMPDQARDNSPKKVFLHILNAIRRLADARFDQPARIDDTATDRCQEEACCGGYNEAYLLQLWANYNPRY